MPALELPVDLALLDLDRDGALDVAVANLQSRAVSLHRNDGAGGFAGGFTEVSQFLLQPRALAAGDLDDDGATDLAVAVVDGDPASFDLARIWLGDGRGGLVQPPPPLPSTYALGPEPSMLALAWFDSGDETLDLLGIGADNSVRVLLGQGGGSLTTPAATFAIGKAPVALALADLDGDGNLDAASANRDGNDVGIRLGDGAGGLAPGAPRVAGAGPSALAAGDLDGDGHTDLLVANELSNDVTLRRGLGGGEFGAQTQLHTGTGPVSLVLGDLDLDGRLDAVVANGGLGTLRLLRNTGGGGLGAEPPFLTGSLPDRVALGDLDRDGALDLLANDTRDNQVVVRLGNGRARFRGSLSLGIGAQPADMALADFDGDGILDLAVAKASTATLNVYRGDGAGGFSAPLALSVGAQPVALAAGDLNDDGALDLLAACLAEGTVSILFGRGDGTFEDDAPLVVPSGDPAAIALGDLDHDGDLDLVVASTSRELSVFRNEGGQSFALLPPPLTTSEAQVDVALADLDGDGHLDLLVLVGTGAELSVRRGTGGGRFAGEQRFAVGLRAGRMAVADLDGDGRLDVAVTDPFDGRVHVLRQRPAAFAFGPVEGGRPGRGDGRGAALVLVRQSFPVTGSPEGIAAGDVNGDGVADLVAAGSGGVQPLISAAVGPSAPEADLEPAFGRPLRRLPVPALPLGAFPALAPPPGTRLLEASPAIALLPETAIATASATLVLPLRAALTREELTAGTFRIFRHLEGTFGTPGLHIDPRFGTHLFAAIEEVAAGAAIVDPAAGTISLPVDRAGRYQAFLQAPSATAWLVRETFDATGPGSGGLAPRPFGWWGNGLWEVGVPSATAIASGERPAPASAPNLLAFGLRHAPARAETAARIAVLHSGAFQLPAARAGRTFRLRMRVWHDLAPGDEVRLSVALFGPLGPAEQTVSTFTGTSPGQVTLSEAAGTDPVFEADLTAALYDGDLVRTADPGAPQDVLAELRFTARLQAGTAPTGRGWFADDVEILSEAP